MEENCTACLELGPPPDRILTLPPPPLPAFLQLAGPNSSAPCNALCDSHLHGVHFVELPSHALSGSGAIDDTWLLVLVTCSVGVLLLGFLLALLLLKCREERVGKTVPLRMESTKKSCEAVLYPGDSRVIWATLTPRGTPRTEVFENSGFEDLRPRVSSPTRIEHPNLPPLNLHPTLKRHNLI
ncbi:uncharacterized protein [Halyomorpha halys]|uniref:uncharacterized protein n=1 Tax=Halyomorpha halys TaxID=286706 RepID=UPI0006D4EBF0|nr:uncharacterized protein LOC106684437 [Halyomorpha halys]